MKSVLTILIFGMFFSFLRAEYNGCHLSFSIELADGSIGVGYTYIITSYCNMDSIHDSQYLKKVLGNQGSQSDSLYFCKGRIKYEYTPVGFPPETKNAIYSLTDRTVVPLKWVKNIRLDSMIEFTYAIWMSSMPQLPDTAWMKQTPILKTRFGVQNCSYQIFVHQNSRKVHHLLKQLEIEQQKYHLLEINSKDGEPSDAEGMRIIGQLMKEKVVVICECWC